MPEPPNDRAKLWFLRGALLSFGWELRDENPELQRSFKRITDLMDEWVPEALGVPSKGEHPLPGEPPQPEGG